MAVKKERAGYIEIPLPRFSFGKKESDTTTPTRGGNVNMVLVVLLMVASFMIGIMYTRLQSLDNKTATPTTIKDALVSYSKQLKLNAKQFTQCLEQGKYKDNVQKDASDAQTVGATGTPATFVNGFLVSGAVQFEEFKRVIDQELQGGQASSGIFPKAYAQGTNFADPSQINPSVFPTPTLPSKVSVEKGHLPLLGNKNAKVTVIEFSDFQCPFCKSMFENSFPQIKKEYIDTGKIAFYYRHLPLTSIHPNAQMAAEASECANEQGKFWEYHDKLFQNQDSWAALPQAVTTTR